MSAKQELSKREQDVLNYLAEGLEYKQIADRLNLRVSTVRSHIHRCYGKLGVSTFRQAIRVGVKQGWIIQKDSTKLDDDERAELIGHNERLRRELFDLYRDLDQMSTQIAQLKEIEKKYKNMMRPPISENHRAYLWAFDHYVNSWAKNDQVGERRMRNAMTLAVGGFLSPEIIQLARSRPDVHPLDRLTQTIELFDRIEAA